MKAMKILMAAVAVSVMAGCSIAPNKLINGEVLKVHKLKPSAEGKAASAKLGVDWDWMVANYDLVTVMHINDFASGAGGNVYSAKSLGVKVGDYVQFTNGGDVKDTTVPVEQRMGHVIVIKSHDDCKWVGSVLLKQTLACKGDSAEVWK